MSRVCELSGVKVQSGNNVSHSQRKTRRKFLPNLHNVTLLSDVLGCKLRFRISASALRSVEANGGIDNYLMSTNADKLSSSALAVKKKLQKLASNN